MSDPSTRTQPDGPAADTYAEKIFTAMLGCMETFSLYLGDRLGWFSELAAGPLTPAELALRTQTNERYAVEWLEMQAVYGNLSVVDDGAGDRRDRRYAMPVGAAEVLTDLHSLAYLGALPKVAAAVGAQLDRLATAYRTGGGVSWAELGDDAWKAQAALNRPGSSAGWVRHWPGCLRWMRYSAQATPASRRRLRRRLVDDRAGQGVSVGDGGRVDVDSPSLEAARENAAAAGVADRVGFTRAGGETVRLHGPFDAAFAFECIHDMPRPVDVLSAMRESVRPAGVVLVMDEAVAETFTAPGDAVEQVMYGYSTLVCLPDGLSSAPSAATGTVMRRSVLTEYAIRAGFSEVEILPIEDFSFFRFYWLR